MRRLQFEKLSPRSITTGNISVRHPNGDLRSITRVFYRRNVGERAGRLELGTHRIIGINLRTGHEVLMGQVNADGSIQMREGVELITLSNKDKRRRETLLKDKSPGKKSRANYVGVELEFLSTVSRNRLLEMLEQANLHKYVNLTTDGSVRSFERDEEYEDEDGNPIEHEYEGEHGYELRVCAKEGHIQKVITAVCAVLAKAKSRVNDTCGLHVHLDMRNRNASSCYQALYNSLDKMAEMVDSDRWNNNFCKRNTQQTLMEHRMFSGGHDRYYAINTVSLERHKTLEIRIHEGSVNSEKISKWISFLLQQISLRNLMVRKAS